VSVIFRYPFSFPYIEEVILPNPTLGDSYRLTNQVLYKQDMQGNTHSHLRTDAYRVLLLNFVVLIEAEKNNLKAFYQAVIGNQIRYEDHDGNVWRGYFQNTNLAITTNRDGCDYSTTIEFSGEIT